MVAMPTLVVTRELIDAQNDDDVSNGNDSGSLFTFCSKVYSIIISFFLPDIVYMLADLLLGGGITLFYFAPTHH